MNEYICFRKVKGLTNKWVKAVEFHLTEYLNYIDWSISKKNTLEYLLVINEKYSISTYIKKVYQIRKFLTFLNIDWAKDINPPDKPHYIPKRMTLEDINNTLLFFNGNRFYKQLKALILLGKSSGIRAEELYQLNIEDIDIGNRILHINHNPNTGQSTKTKMSRISFFNTKAQQAIIEYLSFYNRDNKLKCLFNQSHISRIFKDAPIQVKDLRKFFSQEWDRRNGSTSIKKILMGHSLKGDIDLMHYNAQSPEDLKKIYDKVMCET